jgi:hypothetical protein
VNIGSLNYSHEQGFNDVVLRVSEGNCGGTNLTSGFHQEGKSHVTGLLLEAMVRCVGATHAFARRHHPFQKLYAVSRTHIADESSFHVDGLRHTDPVIYDTGDQSYAHFEPQRRKRSKQRCGVRASRDCGKNGAARADTETLQSPSHSFFNTG